MSSKKMSGLANRQEFLNKLKNSSEVDITVTGRRTKKRFSTPVWFVLDGEKIMLLPTHSSHNDWFKNLVRDQRIELSVKGTVVNSKAKLVRDSEEAQRVLDMLRAKYRSMWSDSYYAKPEVCVEVPL